jgi:Leucine-rich repeat (LRR) protein
MPPTIGNLHNLESLVWISNGLVSIPDEIGNLQRIKNLFFSNNLLASLPSSIARLKTLECLGISYNNFTKIPSVAPLELKELLIHSCPIPGMVYMERADEFDARLPSLRLKKSMLQELVRCVKIIV